MIALALGAALVASPAQDAVTLRTCNDTFLDAELPNENFGRDAALVGGPRKAILVRFPGIGTRLQPGKKVVGARIELRTISSGPVRLRSVGRLLTPWGEGSGRRILPLGSKKEALWEATWTHSRSGDGGAKWAASGAEGTGDMVPIPNVSLVQSEDIVLVTGLESAVQEALRDPDGDHGFRLEFESQSIFMSSELPEFSPRMVVQQSDESVDEGVVLGPIQTGQGGYEVTAMNRGRSLETNVEAVWSFRNEVVAREPLSSSLAPGESVKLSAKIAVPAVLHPAVPQTVTLELRAGSRVLATGTTYFGALTAEFSEAQVQDDTAGRVVRLLNNEAMPFSRYSFAPAGAPARFAVKVAEAGPSGTLLEMASKSVRAQLPKERFLAPDVEPGEDAFGWISDTRDDVFLPPTRWLPAFRWTVRTESDPATPERGWLSAAEVLYLRSLVALAPPAPERGAVRFVGLDGKGVPGATIQVYRLDDEGGRTLFTTAQTSPEGLFQLNTLPAHDGVLPYLSLVVSKGSAKATVGIAGWQFLVESARLKGSTPVVEVGAMLSDPGITTGADLASFKPVSTSDDRLPAETAAAVDGNTDTILEILPDQWLEVDLGRDRNVAGIEIVTQGAAWQRFTVQAFRTGVSAGSPWIREGSGDTRTNVAGGFASGLYTASPTSARRVRITNNGTATVKVAEFRVFATSA